MLKKDHIIFERSLTSKFGQNRIKKSWHIVVVVFVIAVVIDVVVVVVIDAVVVSPKLSDLGTSWECHHINPLRYKWRACVQKMSSLDQNFWF